MNELNCKVISILQRLTSCYSSYMYLINPRIRRRRCRRGIFPSKVMHSGGDARETQRTRDDWSFSRPKRQSSRRRIPLASRLNFTRVVVSIFHLIIFTIIIIIITARLHHFGVHIFFLLRRRRVRASNAHE